VDGESGGYGCLLCVFTRLLHSGACVMCWSMHTMVVHWVAVAW
jgi:hypothetical protein